MHANRGARKPVPVGQSLHHAWRSLRRTPGFTATTVLTLALGVGATVALFTVVNGVLLRPLPYGDPDRLVSLAEPSLRQRGFLVGELSADAKAWLEWVLPGLAASVDRLPQLADRIESVFRWRAPAIPDAEERIVAPVLAEVLLDAPPLVDREAFRAAANRVRERTGLKGKALFHPIRTILTGAQEGPELDLIVPAIERAIDLPGLANVISCKERAAAVANLL